MQVPHAESAVVEREKIVGYLLNPQHPDGASKAKFFLSLGFRTEQWEKLAEALRELINRSPTMRTVESIHGRKYVEGTIQSPGGISPRIRTVWIVDRGRLAPRLVTAYPLQE